MKRLAGRFFFAKANLVDQRVSNKALVAINSLQSGQNESRQQEARVSVDAVTALCDV
jgi:hypothetical protein